MYPSIILVSATSFAIQKVSADPQHKVIVRKEAVGSEEVRRKEGVLNVKRTLRGREVKRPRKYSD